MYQSYFIDQNRKELQHYIVSQQLYQLQPQQPQVVDYQSSLPQLNRSSTI